MKWFMSAYSIQVVKKKKKKKKKKKRKRMMKRRIGEWLVVLQMGTWEENKRGEYPNRNHELKEKLGCSIDVVPWTLTW